MIVFGDKVFKEVTRLNEVIWVGPNPMTGVLIRGRGTRDTCAQRKAPVRTQ